ncbi:MAG TPA: RNA polymerase sigma factor, partial [Gemmataceae bacterium]|nr:RNA polymerase sigma factor [Gemmataceae bacterium]
GYRALHTLSDPAKVGTWLMGIGLRAALDWLKAKERSTVPFSGLGPDRPVEALISREESDPAADADERRRLMVEVEALPETLRQAVMLYYYDDLSYRELGELLRVSAATINARLTKARSILRERLTSPCEPTKSLAPCRE